MAVGVTCRDPTRRRFSLPLRRNLWCPGKRRLLVPDCRRRRERTRPDGSGPGPRDHLRHRPFSGSLSLPGRATSPLPKSAEHPGPQGLARPPGGSGTPPPATRASKHNAVNLNRLSNMDRSISRARAAAEAERPAPAAGPAAKWIAALVVVRHREDEMHAEAWRGPRAVASAAEDRTTPRRVSARVASLAPGPTGCARSRPGIAGVARPRRVSGPRNSRGPPAIGRRGQAGDLAVEDLGLLAVDRRSVGCRRGVAHVALPETSIVSPCARRRRAICCLARRAIRMATPYNQLPSRSGSRIDRPF